MYISSGFLKGASKLKKDEKKFWTWKISQMHWYSMTFLLVVLYFAIFTKIIISLAAGVLGKTLRKAFICHVQ